MLKDANDYSQAIPRTFLGLSGKTVGGHYENLVQDIEDKNQTQFHEHELEYQNDMYKYHMHKWYIEQNKRLANEMLWQQFETQCKTNDHRTKLLTLKKMWFQQARFSYYTSDAFVELADHVLPVFENYLHLLKTEFELLNMIFLPL